LGLEQVWRAGFARLALSAVAVALVLLAVSCGSGENAQGGGQGGGQGNGGGEGSGESAGNGGDASGGDTGAEDSGGDGGSGGGTQGAEEEPAEPEKPYAAIKPSADAIPLSERLGEDEEEDEERGGGTNGDSGGETTGGKQPGSDQYQYGQYDQYGNQYGQYAGGAQYEEPAEEPRTVPVGEVLLKGKEDRSDGPLVENRMVAYYGHPSTGLMGELGRYEPERMMEKLKEQTAAYSEIDPERPAIPTIELIASVAQPTSMSDGSFLTRLDRASIEEYAKLAEKHKALLLLDVQLGRSTVMEELEVLRPFLERPYVHLAIDTEYSVEEGEIPGQDLGEVAGPEIQQAVEELDRMVEEEGIPDKVLMVHQFESGIVTQKDAIKPTDNVQVVLHADGFGGPAAKLAKYDLLVRDEPIQYGGFKLFYPLDDPSLPGQDIPLLEPEEVLALDPAPAVVTYQ